MIFFQGNLFAIRRNSNQSLDFTVKRAYFRLNTLENRDIFVLNYIETKQDVIDDEFVFSFGYLFIIFHVRFFFDATKYTLTSKLQIPFLTFLSNQNQLYKTDLNV